MGGSKSPCFCSECGKPVLSHAAFCAQCGAPINLDSEQAKVKDEGGAPDFTQETIPRDLVAGKKRSKIPCVLLALASLLVIATALIVFMLWLVPRFEKESGDDVNTSGYPVEFSEEIHRQYPQPAQLVYYHFISKLYAENQDSIRVGSPKISDKQVDIDVTIDGQKFTFRTIEITNDGKAAEVFVGLADSEADEIFVLRKTGGKWIIAGTRQVELRVN
ncbi:MAG: zinc ribbon domain-containing protein [Verrucomicrobiota bacterium]